MYLIKLMQTGIPTSGDDVLFIAKTPKLTCPRKVFRSQGWIYVI
jgi:hypothetical protein